MGTEMTNDEIPNDEYGSLRYSLFVIRHSSFPGEHSGRSVLALLAG
jgi:hypothetical protein